MYKVCLFDLDGTLTESHPGIIRSVRYALKKMGYPDYEEKDLLFFVGPPLDESFMTLTKMSREKAGQAIAFYREVFSTEGKYENSVYAGIPELLKKLRSRGIILAIASSKPETFVRDILDHFDLEQYFDIICGATMDGTRSRKPDIIRYALQQAGLEIPDEKDSDPGSRSEEVIMIGDRKYDVTGAHKMGMAAVGVTWGYGSREELLESGADALADSPEELFRLLS